MRLSLYFRVPAPPAIYTLSLHDALPISAHKRRRPRHCGQLDTRHDRGSEHPDGERTGCDTRGVHGDRVGRSEEHTSELQSHSDLVCRLLLEKKKKTNHGLRTTSNSAPRN